MTLHLAEASAMVSPAQHAALRLDRASWHLAGGVTVLETAPPCCHVWNRLVDQAWCNMSVCRREWTN
ncbi:MAG: hypothetical protein KGJ41_12290 [Rhodospirillales bacterium]|nr:hypothetical protein [Rhodospirillales bacterium]